jgi:hypothetical protein
MVTGVQTCALPISPGFNCEIYKARLSPVGEVPLISNEFAQFTVSASVLVDTLKSSSGPLGQYGRIWGV